MLRVETINGLHLLCGGIIPIEEVKVGQTWAAADGSKMTVNILEAGEWVIYEGDLQPIHTKDNFSFQCRYCLVLDEPVVPSQFIQEE
jgi:hypothetical protein